MLHVCVFRNLSRVHMTRFAYVCKFCIYAKFAYIIIIIIVKTGPSTNYAPSHCVWLKEILKNLIKERTNRKKCILSRLQEKQQFINVRYCFFNIYSFILFHFVCFRFTLKINVFVNRYRQIHVVTNKKVI